MNYKLSIRKDAEADIREAFQFYESCRAGLGREFLLCLEAALESVQRHPLAFRSAHKNVLRSMMHRFPYGIYFVVQGDRVVVIALMHARCDPVHWKTRG